MKKIIGTILSSVIISVSALSAQAAVSTDELKIGITQEFENLNPMNMTMVASFYLYNLAGRALDTMNTDGKWYPQLAKSIPTVENGGAKIVTINGKKTVQAVWEIIEAAKWSDGKPVTCEDFLFARTVADSNNVSVGSKETYTQVDKIEWDPKTPKKCTFTYDKARWDFTQLGQFYPLPKHIDGPVFEQYKNVKEGYDKNSNYTKNPTMPGLYNGPYKIDEVKLGSHVTFSPNPYFYGPQPHFKKIIVKLIPNDSTLEANLTSGNIDTVSSLGFAFDKALAFEKKVKAQNLPYTVMFKPSLTYEHIDLNLTNPMLKDVKVRKALVFAINRDDLVKALFEGKQQAAIHNLTSIDPWYTDDPKYVVKYSYSKRDAGKLLDEAGWKLNDKDGYRYKDGKKLSLVFMTTAGNKTRETVQTYLQGQWKAVGIDVQIKNEPARVFFGDTTKKMRYGAMAMYAWTSSPESNPKPQFHSSQIPTSANGFSGQNYTGWKNAKVDELMEKLEGEFDAAKRKAMVGEITRYYTDEVPVIPLYYRADIAVPPTALRNFKLPGHQFSETNEVETWDIK